MVVVLIVSLLIGAVGVGVWTTAELRMITARRRVRLAAAEQVARAATRTAASWLEAADRKGLVSPPELGEIDRDGRRPDPDGDGDGELWSQSDPPHDVRFKEGASGSEEVFGGPDGPGSRNRFLGTADGPDILLRRSGVQASAFLENLSAMLDPSGRVQVSRIAFFRAPGSAGDDALATIEVTCEAQLPGGVPLKVRARGEAHGLPWGRPDRPLMVAEGARFSGDAGWQWGEAVVGEDLHAAEPTWKRWPSGVPWADVDRPMRRDNDADGTADDRDGDGEGDWAAWHSIPDTVEDPWWRARVGEAWPEVEPDPGACAPAFPFGPWADPPEDPVKDGERSGIRLACPLPEPIEPIPEAWARLARAGTRGFSRYVEQPGRLGWFRRQGRGEPRPLDEIGPKAGEVVWLELADTRTEPLDRTFSGEEGGLLVSGGDLALTGGSRRERLSVLPGDLRRTPGGSEGPYLRTVPDGPLAERWNEDDWFGEGEGPGPQPPREDGTEPVHFRGLVAVEGSLTIRGDYRHLGTLRARDLKLDAAGASIRVKASHGPGRFSRWGPPGGPRVWVRNLRILR
jgi:hypothetical protein